MIKVRFHICLIVLLTISGFLSSVQVIYAQQHRSEVLPTKEEIRNSAVIYKNEQYGFQISLPSDWEGYKVEWGKWQNQYIPHGKQAEKHIAGPMIYIRNPQATKDQPCPS